MVHYHPPTGGIFESGERNGIISIKAEIGIMDAGFTFDKPNEATPEVP